MIEDNTFITSEGINRRGFLKLCAALAATMGLSANASAEIAASVSRKDCPPRHLDICTGVYRLH